MLKCFSILFFFVFCGCYTMQERESILRQARAQRLHDIRKVLKKIDTERKNYVVGMIVAYDDLLIKKLSEYLSKELEGVKAENFYNIYKAYKLQQKEVDKKIQREVSGKYL